MNFKVKAKSKNTGKWIYGFFMYDWDNKDSILKPMIQELPNKNVEDISSFTKNTVDIKTVCKPTQVFDKKNNEIFENDIVYCEQWNPKKYVVKYEDGGFILTNKNVPPFKISHIWDSTGVYFEIVGNYIDTPELLSN